jgi:glycyl-tRNA synthetase beta subunit
MTTILFELGTEELPPKNLKTLRDALLQNVKNALVNADITFDEIKAYAAPRRLAVQIFAVSEKQPDKTEQKRGPSVKAAFDADGNLTKAGQGFAQGLGVDKNKLITIHTEKGDYIGYEIQISGQKTTDLLPAIFQKALDDLPIAKRMRWGASKEEFVRPVKWVVLMANNQVIDTIIQGHQTSNQSCGHRYHAPEFFDIPHANDYEKILLNHKVIADFNKRRQDILSQVEQLANKTQAVAVIPDELLDEVTALVDLPIALLASFDERFLAVPQEALISTMQSDQKYFCLIDNNGKLKPNFIFISNIDSTDKNQVILGNEKVVRPRLADAEFFFLQDQKQPLFAFSDSLKNQVFQDKLGTIWEKSERIAQLSAFIAAKIGADAKKATRAGLLSKCDLASTLVGEFPELQGIAGTYYAKKDEAPEVAEAIFEQYLPKFSGDALPNTPIGIALALADRLDTLVGIFGIGQAPTGSKDPFSLRRNSIGVLRILIEKQLSLNLAELVEQAALAYGDKISSDTVQNVLEFFAQRYRAMYTEQGVAVDTIIAVQEINTNVPFDFDRRVRAVQEFRQLSQAKSLAEANKRVANILAKADFSAQAVDVQLLHEPSEVALYQAVAAATEATKPMLDSADYQALLLTLSHLDKPLNDFFDHVMVNVDDVNLKNNRLALLSQIRMLFLSVADIGLLQG